MKLNDAKDIRLGEIPVQSVYLDRHLIWSQQNHVFMPVMDGITNYYDCHHGLTSERWENMCGGEDIIWTGMIQQADGSAGIYGTRQSHGEFQSDYVLERSVYALFRTDPVGLVMMNPLIIGAYGSNVSGGFFTIQVDGYVVPDNIGSDQNYIGVQSDVTSEKYHVAALTRTASGLNTIYVDGIEKGTLQNNVPYGNTWGVGLLITDTGYITSPLVMQYIKMLAVGSEVHTPEQIAKNSAWLAEHFGLESEEEV